MYAKLLWALRLRWLGAGLAVGWMFSEWVAQPVGLWSGVGVLAIGLLLIAFGPRRPLTIPAHADDAGPTAAGLGGRVEHILQLAERQAEDHRIEAGAEAEKILSAARAEAKAIVDAARNQS